MNKILIITSSLLPISQTFVKSQMKALKRWDPILAAASLCENGIDVSEINTLTLPGSSKWSINWWLRKVCAYLNFPHIQTYFALKKQNASLVHIHFGNVAVDIWPIVKMLNVPVIITLHGTDINTNKSWWMSGKGGVHNKSYPKRLLSLIKSPNVTFIAVSKAVKNRAVEYGIPEDKILVSYIGVDTDTFKPSGKPVINRNNNILFVGRMIENKGPLVLIEAFKTVITKIPDASLIMIGDGPLLKEAKKLADKYYLPITFLGAQPSSEVLKQLSLAKVFCLPSYTLPTGQSEGMPIVTLEAQACGVPVVTSARGSSTEGIINGETGFRVKEKSVDDLSEKLIKTLTCDQFCLKAPNEARRFICESFDIKACSKKLEDIYDRAASITKCKDPD